MQRCYNCMNEYKSSLSACPHCGYINRSNLSNLTSVPELEPGTLLQKRYFLGRVLEYDKLYISYIAWDNRLCRTVCVKEYFPIGHTKRVDDSNEAACDDESFSEFYRLGLKRTLSEAQSLVRLSDVSGIVRILDGFEENSTAYIVTEYCDGITVEQALSTENSFSAEKSISIASLVALALSEMHSKGIIHKAVSPDSIILCNDGSFRLQSFCGSRILATLEDKESALKAGYAPVEQYASPGKTGTFTDTYALCATLYRMLTGNVPQIATERTVNDELKPISKFNVVPSDVANIITKGLSVSHEKRIRSADTLFDCFSNFKGTGESTQKSSRINVKKILTVAAIVALVTVLGTTLFYLISDNNPPVNEDVPSAPTGFFYNDFSVGSTVSFGRYDNRQLEWTVLDRDGSKALLLSNDLLDMAVFHHDSNYEFCSNDAAASWKTSLLRDRMNTEFYTTTFSAEEQKRIIPTEIETPDNPLFGTPGCGTTTDRVFFLSYQEAEEYRPLILSTQNLWYLRSPGQDYSGEKNGTVMVVGDDMTYESVNVSDFLENANSFIRPAIWVDINMSYRNYADYEYISEYKHYIDDFSWYVDDDTLYIEGEGVISSYLADEVDCKESIKHIVIEEGITHIPSFVFQDMNIISVSLPDSIIEIGDHAFRDCTSLTDIQLPKSVVRIGQAAFTNTGIANNAANWKNNMLCINDYLIRVSRKATGTVTVPSNIRAIASLAFYECNNVTEVVLSDKIKYLDNTFSWCSSLEKVIIPDSVEYCLGAFDYCESLQNVRLPDKIKYVNGFYACGMLESIVLPKEAQYIELQGFCCCWSLSEITLYNNIIHIGDSAFFNCPCLESVRFYGSEEDWSRIHISKDNDSLIDSQINFI